MIASYFGLERVVKLLLEIDSVDLNSEDNYIWALSAFVGCREWTRGRRQAAAQ